MSNLNNIRNILLIIYLLKYSLAGIHQRRLLKYLLEDNKYNPLERPVYNDSDTLLVTMNLALQQIIDFDEKRETLVINGWAVLTWYDYSLQWKPEEFGNIQTIRLPSTRVWTPDILLYNSADENFDRTMKTNLVLHSNGTILFVPPGIFKSICPFDVTSFPFVSVNLTAEDTVGQLDAYVPNAEWDLQSFNIVRQALVYECCPTVYPFVLFTIQIRRRTLYYVVNVVVPCVLISFMTVLGFLLPPDSGEKLTLQITILLSIIMFSVVISEIIPSSSTALPIIVTYFTVVMCMCSLSVVATVIVLALHHRNAKNHKMPMWIKLYINQYLAFFLRMKRPGYDLSWKGIRKFHRKLKHNSISTSLLANIAHIEEYTCFQSKNHFLKKKNEPIESSCSYIDENYDTFETCDINSFYFDIHLIISELKYLAEYVQKEDEYDDVSQDWKFSAMVIDRSCLLLFTLMTTVFSYITLFSAPNFFKFR